MEALSQANVSRLVGGSAGDVWICDADSVLIANGCRLGDVEAADACGTWTPTRDGRQRGACHAPVATGPLVQVHAHPGVLQTLRAARTAGVRLGVVASHGATAEAALVSCCLYKYIDCLVTDEEVRRQRPAPDSLLLALQLLKGPLGCKSHATAAVWVGTRAVDVQAAKAARMITVHAAYCAPGSQVRGEQPDYIIRSFGDMRRFLPWHRSGTLPQRLDVGA